MSRRKHKHKATAELSAAAEVRTESSDYEELIIELLARLEEDPASVPIKIALAEALFRSTIEPPMAPMAALKRLNRAIALDPFRPAFYYHRGMQWHRLENFTHAQSNYLYALRFDPENPRILHQIALAHLDVGQTDEARAAWDKTEKILHQKSSNGSRPNLQINQATLISANGAEPWLQRALFFVQCGRAEIELRAGTPDKAIEYLRAVKPPPSCVLLAGEMALKYLVLTGDVVTLQEWLNESFTSDDAQKIMRHLRPYIDVYEGEAKEEFSLSPAETASYATRALRAMVAFDWAQRDGRDADKALTALKGLAEAEPEDDTLLDASLALLHHEAARLYNEEQWIEACDLWREALLIDRHNHGVTHNLALAATRAKEETEYEKWWDKTQRLWYARNFILPESDTYRRLISDKHFAFATKAANVARRWDNDTDPLEAVTLWVDEMERYFLVEQYSCASAYNLLGVPKTADDDAIRQAYEVMKLKTKRYSDVAPELKDALKITRVKKLEEAYKFVAAAPARKNYRPAQDIEEATRADVLRKRKVSYIIAVSNLLKEKAKELPVEAADKYATIAPQLLQHPYQALQRLFQNELKADADAEASDQIRETLATFYFKKCEELLGDSGREPDDVEKAKQLLKHLHDLELQDWQSLYFLAQLERAVGNNRMAVKLAEKAYDNCYDSRAMEQIDEFIRGARKGADLQEFLEPALEHIDKGRWAEALKLLKKAIEVNPRAENLYFYAARCCMGLKHWSEALGYLDQAVNLGADQAVIYLFRATSLLHIAVEEISNGRRPKSKRSLDDVQEVIERGRKCPDFETYAEDFQNLETQLSDLKSRLS